MLGNVSNVLGRELLAGAPRLDKALAIDPSSGEILIELYGQGGTGYGRSLADAGDFNNDGVAGFAVGQPGLDAPPLLYNGRALVYSATPWITRYCTAGTSSNSCSPVHSWSGAPYASAGSGFQFLGS